MKEKTNLPWENRFPKKDFKHPQTISQLLHGEANLKWISEKNQRFILHGSDYIQNYINPVWPEFYFVGPFLNKKRDYYEIPILVAVDFRKAASSKIFMNKISKLEGFQTLIDAQLDISRPYYHLTLLSGVFGYLLIDTEILSRIHLFESSQMRTIEDSSRGWQRTIDYSLHWSIDDYRPKPL